MRKKYLVSYDLGGPETREDYQRLIKRIKEYPAWAKPLQSVWIVLSDLTAEQIRDDLRTKIDGNDALLVVELTGWWATYGVEQNQIDWMKNHL